jgi:coenzyme PQQ precursor peptide PqqA
MIRHPQPPARHSDREVQMAWKKPRITEICLGLEINSYASAEIA